jgi:hypothetical protein
MYVGGSIFGAAVVTADEAREVGRIDFEDADLPPATVEVDVSQGMLGDLFGLGEAAVAGMAETLAEAAGQSRGGEGTQLAAEQLAAARQIMEIAQGVVKEVRVRVYEDLPEESTQPGELMRHYDSQLRAGDWENIVRVRDGDENVRVSLLRESGAIRGAFIVVLDGSDLVLANVVGDVSPENVKKLTSAAAKIGLDNGLEQVLEEKMREMKMHRPRRGDGPAPPQPPTPPKLEEVRR